MRTQATPLPTVSVARMQRHLALMSTTGQLRTAAALDYETQSTYRVTVNVFDGNGGQNSIVVTIYVWKMARLLHLQQHPLLMDR